MKGIALLFQERIYCFLCDKLSCAHILIGSHSWSIGGQMYSWRHHQNFFNYLLYKKNRFQVAVRLLCNRSQRASKCGKTIVMRTLGCASCVTFLFWPHFDVICDLLLNRRTATWNLFVNQSCSCFSVDFGFSRFLLSLWNECIFLHMGRNFRCIFSKDGHLPLECQR